jgi:hypothetical protein
LRESAEGGDMETMSYFSGLFTVEDVKVRYRELAKTHHPDIGGNTETMQAINAEYHATLARLDGQESTGTDGKRHRYTYQREREQAIMDKIAELLRVLPAGVEVLLIGLWVWIQGTSREDTETRAALKKAGCSWHGKRGCWYWRPEEMRHYGRQSRGNLMQLAWRYGCRGFAATDEERGRAVAIAVA